MSDKISIYIEAVGLAEDENGNPAQGAVEIKLGEFAPGQERPRYSELIAGKDPLDVIRRVLPASFAMLIQKARFITPEEYERDYGSDDKEATA